MLKLGRFLFRYRNLVGPAVVVIALALSEPHLLYDSVTLDQALDAAGWCLALLGEAIRVVTIGYEYVVRGGKNREVFAEQLVDGGMFALCRNPMYLGNVLIATGIALVINAYAFYLIVIPAIVVTYLAIVKAEEAYLREKFGAQYEDYCRRVNRWWPRLTGFRNAVAGRRFNWRRVLVKEYTTIFLLIGVLVCLDMWSDYIELGADTLPSADLALFCAFAWMASYLAVRALKKSGYVRD